MSKEGFNTNDIDSIVARCSKCRHIDESNLKRKTLETGALPSATHDAGVVILSSIASVLASSDDRLEKEWEEQERIRRDNYYYYDNW
ncbi:hypothetical protein AAGW04_20455 [Pectobacterium aroidearum]|uniref:hypothetical protein n=1 Tax=Pectobacterium aroidearum TaxID=1201031 RepID=UPI0031590900